MSRRPKLRSSGPAHPSADSKGLPAGWIKVESKSKPGAFYYAHPATKRTQVEHPGKSKKSRTAKSSRGPLKSGQVALDVDSFEDPADKADRLRREAEEAEEAEAERQELVRQQRAAKRALLKEAEDTGKKDDSESEEDREHITQEELERWKQNEERREQEEAEAEQRRKEEEERQRKEAEEAERRRIEEEKAEKERQEEEERQRRQAQIDMWKREREFEAALARERAKQQEIELERLRLIQAEMVRSAEEARQQKDAEERKNAEAELRKKAEAERVKKETEQKRKEADEKDSLIPEPQDKISVPCFDVFKLGRRIGRHILSGSAGTWSLGRAPVGVDIQVSHDSVSRKHAEVTRQGMFAFIMDLGSAHGTTLNRQKLLKHTQQRLCSGDNLQFGGSSRVYVYREPASAFNLSSTGSSQVGFAAKRRSEQEAAAEVEDPPIESPKLEPAEAPAPPAGAMDLLDPPLLPRSTSALLASATSAANSEDSKVAPLHSAGDKLALQSKPAEDKNSSSTCTGKEASEILSPKKLKHRASSSSSSSSSRKNKRRPKSKPAKRKKSSSSSASKGRNKKTRKTSRQRRTSSSSSASKNKKRKCDSKHRGRSKARDKSRSKDKSRSRGKKKKSSSSSE